MIPADDLMVLAAFRYCLGRRSYIVGSCVDWLIENWDGIYDHRQNIIDEIEAAIENGYAGEECDVAQWRRILEVHDAHMG